MATNENKNSDKLELLFIKIDKKHRESENLGWLASRSIKGPKPPFYTSFIRAIVIL